MQLKQPFVRLPFLFDANRLQDEIASIAPGDWLAHPSGMKGNAAAPLITHQGQANDEFHGHMQLTPIIEQRPYLRQVMASFNEVLGRSRLMRLAPGSEVSQHVDFNYHWFNRVRIHVPITTQPSVTFFCGDEQIHMQAGSSWIFDSWRRHRVVNAGDAERVHLVIDTAGSSNFWRTVEREIRKPSEPELLDYDPAWQGQIRTERFNTPPVMAPGEVDYLVLNLIDDFSSFPDNNQQTTSKYIELLHDFRHDWRSVWYQYGIGSEGFDSYQQLIQRLVQGLDSNPRALIVSSNQVGVNPIIMQRIVRAVFQPALLEEFMATDS